MIADSVLLAGLTYVERSMKAEQKQQEEEAVQEVQQKHEMDKKANRAQSTAARQNHQRVSKKRLSSNGPQKKYHIQQPMKRD